MTLIDNAVVHGDAPMTPAGRGAIRDVIRAATKMMKGETMTTAAAAPAAPSTPVDVLCAAADLIERTGWTQGVLARDRRGDGVSPTSPKACAFCARGAIQHVLGVDLFRGMWVDHPLLWETMAVWKEAMGINMIGLNEHADATGEAIVSALRLAAERAEKAAAR